jgi:hypothetical protein
MNRLDVPTREHAVPAVPPAVDEAAARRALRAQIALLEHRLSCAVVESMPDGGVVTGVPALRGPRILTLGELERLRDALAGRVADARTLLEERECRRQDARLLLERMLLEPGRHRHVRIPRRELGEAGCGVWHVRPRLGVVGRFMGWWQVKLSSGCPLAT